MPGYGVVAHARQRRGHLGAAFRTGMAAALFLLSWTGVASAARAALYVEGPHANAVTRDVGVALSSRASAEPSHALEAALRSTLDGDSLAHGLSTGDGARQLATAARASFEQSGADFAVIVALPPDDAAERRVAILLVPRKHDSSALLQSAELPHAGSVKARIDWWARTFRSPEKPPTRLDDEASQAAATPVSSRATDAGAPSEDLLGGSPYNAALADGAAGASGETAVTPVPDRPARAPPTDQPTQVTASTPDPPEKRTTHPPRYFLRVGFEESMRDFRDIEPGRGATRTYHAFPVPAVAVGAEAYPLLGVLGLDGSYERSLDVSSTTSQRKSVGTTFTRAEVALKGRIPFSSKERAPWLALLAGYGYTQFSFDSAPAGREIPTAQYHALRFGADTRIPVKRFHFTGGAEFDHLVSIGKLGTSRAHAPGNGVTGRLGAGVALVPWLAARVDARFTFLTYDMVRTPAAHSTDQYVTLAFTLEALF